MSIQPNILFFLTDDHGPWSLPCYGNRALQTPTFDRLAREGAVFANAFTPSPVCSPARACLLTGRTPSQVGIHDWLQEADRGIAERPWLAGEVTLPELLERAGYHTMLSGKWHLGQSYRTPSGFRRCFGLPGDQGEHNERYTYHLDGTPVTLAGNKSQHITDHAIRFLDAAPNERPFYLQVGYIATHSPYDAQAHDPAVVRALADTSFADFPECVPHPWKKNEGFDADDSLPDEVRRRRLGYYAAVTEIDREMERLLACLERKGQLDHTYIVYVSDHGCALGHHGFFGKGNSTRPLNMYDVSLRVPLIVRGPGVAPGRRVGEHVDHYDLFQALAEWGGLPENTRRDPARQYPGRSLAPLAAGKPVPDWNNTRFGEYGDLRMIRTPRHKLVKRYPGGPHDFFDLVEDPGETVNLFGIASRAETRIALERQMEAWYAQHETPARSGLRVKALPRHNLGAEAWRDGRREAAGLQIY